MTAASLEPATANAIEALIAVQAVVGRGPGAEEIAQAINHARAGRFNLALEMANVARYAVPLQEGRKLLGTSPWSAITFAMSRVWAAQTSAAR